LLANAIRSIEEFFPWGDRLLVDDGSSDPASVELIAKLKKLERWTCIVRDRHHKQTYGGFYKNMRTALQFAVERDYDYCFFFQDDEEFVWHKPDYHEYVDRVFETCPDAIQLQPLFFRRLISYNDQLEYIRSANVYRSNRGFSTTAIWNLSIVRAHPDYEFIA